MNWKMTGPLTPALLKLKVCENVPGRLPPAESTPTVASLDLGPVRQEYPVGQRVLEGGDGLTAADGKRVGYTCAVRGCIDGNGAFLYLRGDRIQVWSARTHSPPYGSL